MPDGVRLERARLHERIVAEVPGRRDHTRSEAVSGRLRASWQRSQDYGVSLGDIDPVFTGTFDEGSLYFECGREVLTGLHQTLTTEPISLMLTDADGLVLNRLCSDASLLRTLDTVHLAPGFSYGERVAGTTGLGLALADRVPSLVRAEEHYAISLCTYTCAAVPVIDPLSERLEGSVNLTTWSKSSSGLLLALAQSAANNTMALMLARSQGKRPRPAPRGAVFRVENPRLEPGAGSSHDLSPSWRDALSLAQDGFRDGRVLACIGEPGSGRTTMMAQALRRTFPCDRILAASNPAPSDAEAWLSLWTPELGKPHTAVIVRDVDSLPTWVAEHLRDLVVRARADARFATGDPRHPLSLTITAEKFEDIPRPLQALAEGIIPVTPLRERQEDIVPLARTAAFRARGRQVDLTPAAERALRNHPWPGNVEQLQRVIKQLALRHDVIGVQNLPAELMSSSKHRLSRVQAFERDEIVRMTTGQALTMRDIAERLGMSRSTLYRKISQYGVQIPRRAAR